MQPYSVVSVNSPCELMHIRRSLYLQKISQPNKDAEMTENFLKLLKSFEGLLNFLVF